MKDEVSVCSGQVQACKGQVILRASAIGSCVVVAAYEPNALVGGMAHVMLPGASRDNGSPPKAKYAEHALKEMLHEMAGFGAKKSRVLACLGGGGNVLESGHVSPGSETTRSVADILERMRIATVAKEVGGTQRRSCSLDVALGRVTYTVGSSEQRVLWEVQRT